MQNLIRQITIQACTRVHSDTYCVGRKSPNFQPIFARSWNIEMKSRKGASAPSSSRVQYLVLALLAARCGGWWIMHALYAGTKSKVSLHTCSVRTPADVVQWLHASSEWEGAATFRSECSEVSALRMRAYDFTFRSGRLISRQNPSADNDPSLRS